MYPKNGEGEDFVLKQNDRESKSLWTSLGFATDFW